MFLFGLKKLLGALLLPLPAAMFVAGLGLALLWRQQRRLQPSVGARPSTLPLRLLTAGFALLWLASLPLTGHVVLGALEAEVPCLDDAALPDDVVAIVALGAGYHPEPGRPLTSTLSSHAVARVTEATRLARLLPAARLHCSGWGGRYEGSNAGASCALAVALGVAATRTVIHAEARDTAEEAAAVAAAVPAGRVIVVTDAGHMPRALGLFRAAGVDAIGAPMGHRVGSEWSFWPLPSERSLDAASTAMHEWIGRLWAWMMR